MAIPRTRSGAVATHHLPIALSIGKGGITPGVLKQLELELKHRGTVKVRFLKSFIEQQDKTEAAKSLTQSLKVILEQQIGNIVVLRKR